MARQTIDVTLNHEEYFVPEKIVFSTVFLLPDPQTLDEKLTAFNAKFLHFLVNNQIDYSGPYKATIDNNGIVYTYPSYLVTLTYDTYSLLETYRDANPELAGHTESSVFSAQDRKTFLQNTIEEAREMAIQKARTEGFSVLADFEIEEISSGKRGWVVYPPLSARINHFRQTLTGHYVFHFAAEKLPPDGEPAAE
ncbi:hypothetical protein [Spirosoma sp. KNUC1025]|uniref:hypothetical protein n=1 Tax=Spirosoma sp. KNUC1025 TaxID=2894082 RepID=UPI0038638C40|nr:hypothetical protein LN737_23110 [Spirosoma sp. KNUC1025]